MGIHENVERYAKFRAFMMLAEPIVERQLETGVLPDTRRLPGVQVARMYHVESLPTAEIAQKVGKSIRRVDEERRRGEAYIRHHCPTSSYDMYPLRDPIPRRPDLQETREKKSEAMGGRSHFIAKQVKNGVPVEEAVALGTRTKYDVKTARNTLRDWQNPIEIPYKRRTHREIETMVEELVEMRGYERQDRDILIQQLLDRVDKNFYKKYHEYFVTISDILQEVGIRVFNTKVRLFAEALRAGDKGHGASGMPVGKADTGEGRSVYFVFCEDRQRAIDSLQIMKR